MAEMKAPVLVGHDSTGKPRVRVGANFDLGVYRKMNGLAGELGYWPQMQSGKSAATVGRAKATAFGHDAERNSEMVRGGLDRKANLVVGASLRVEPQPDTRWLGMRGAAAIDWQIEFAQDCASVFQEWALNRTLCDAERHYDFGGMMWQAFRSLSSADAEVAAVIHYDRERAERYNSKWATCLQLVDPERISNPDGTQNGPNLWDGRTLDNYGAMTGMHVSVEHPADARKGPMRWEYVPRETLSGRAVGIHWFIKRRPGMQRAITSLSTVINSIYKLEKGRDAALQNMITHAMLAAYVKSTMAPEEVANHLAPSEDLAGLSEFETKLDAYGKMDLKLGDKRIPVMGPNDSIEFEAMKGSAIDFDPFFNSFVREVASSLGISAEQLTLDFTRASYSSIRSSIMEAGRQVATEFALFSRGLCAPVYDAVIEEGFALGILKTPPGAPDFYDARGAYTRCSFTGPGMGWIDPLKEIDAAKGRIGSGVKTLRDEAAAQGGNWHDNLIQRAIEEKTAERLGVDIVTSAAARANEADELIDATEEDEDGNLVTPAKPKPTPVEED